MACYCIVAGSFVSTWAFVVGVRQPPRSFYLRGNAADVFGGLVFAPIIESLMLVGVFELLRRVRAPDWVQVVGSASFISEWHVWPWWPHAAIVLPSFLIQAASYLYWRSRSWKEAFWVLSVNSRHQQCHSYTQRCRSRHAACLTSRSRHVVRSRIAS